MTKSYSTLHSFGDVRGKEEKKMWKQISRKEKKMMKEIGKIDEWGRGKEGGERLRKRDRRG